MVTVNRIKQKNIILFILLATGYGLLSIFLAGCVTVPVREALPTYSLNGITYLPLVSLCELRGINWEYDTFARTVTLSKNSHKVSLMVGDTLILVDGNPIHLKHPIDIYQGTVVVPYRFKEQIIDTLFRESYPYRKATVPLHRIRKIVIDAGHGGQDPGAIGKTGLREKDINLDIAKRLSKLLKSDGTEVVMTRSTDRFIPLSTRVDIANHSKADLFVSIHANANRVRRLNGIEVYYVSPSINDSKRALLAAKDAALDIDSNCFGHSSLNLKAILWDMIYTNNRAESIELARSICRSINRSLGAEILGIKGANYEVLRGAHMPAVLVETGFLSNYNEERMLRNSYYRQKIAESIAEGINNYDRDLLLMEARR
jgi:N-acetylmuramoyl-L-alanine amidase